jgi:predicted ester cyclase
MSQGSTPTKLVSQVGRLFEEVFHKQQYQLLDELLAPDFVFQYPFSGFSSGGKGIRQFSEMFHAALPGFELEVHDLFGTEDKAGIRWTLRGRHDGNLLGLGATARYVTLSAIGFYGGGPFGNQIANGWLEMNTLGMLQQLDKVQPINALFPGLRQN